MTNVFKSFQEGDRGGKVALAFENPKKEVPETLKKTDEKVSQGNATTKEVNDNPDKEISPVGEKNMEKETHQKDIKIDEVVEDTQKPSDTGITNKVEQGSVETNNTDEMDPSLNPDMEKSLNVLRQSMLDKYNKKKEQKTVEETHTRTTFLLRNDLKKG